MKLLQVPHLGIKRATCGPRAGDYTTLLPLRSFYNVSGTVYLIQFGALSIFASSLATSGTGIFKAGLVLCHLKT